MGKIHLAFTPEQKLIFDQVSRDEFIRSNFYFTGGTALSIFYLQHRYSDDMDFFSEKKINNNVILSFVEECAAKNGFTFKSQFKEVVYIFNLIFNDTTTLKVDFGYYPHIPVEKGIEMNGVKIDSLLDIAINKLATINQRSNVKDYVDLYYLLDKFSIWYLMEGAKVKFRMEIDSWLLATDLGEAEKFTTIPRMIKPLSLDKLKLFFRNLAKELGSKVVEK